MMATHTIRNGEHERRRPIIPDGAYPPPLGSLQKRPNRRVQLEAHHSLDCVSARRPVFIWRMVG